MGQSANFDCMISYILVVAKKSAGCYRNFFLTGSLAVCPNNEKMKLVNDKAVTCVHDADCGEALWSCQGGHCCSRPVNTGVWLGLNISLYYRFRRP